MCISTIHVSIYIYKYSISTPSSYFMTPQLTLPKTITETAIYYILLPTEKFLNPKKVYL